MHTLKITRDTVQKITADLSERGRGDHSAQEESVNAIIADVRARGDEALLSCAERFDGVKLDADSLEVVPAEVEKACALVAPGFLEVVRKAAENIRSYHEKQRQTGWFDAKAPGVIVGQKVEPIGRVGVYVPGGKAAYPSSVLMNILPAKVAGVDEVVMSTPCDGEGKVSPQALVAAKEAGADRVFKAGGAQAIAAMAFGTETVPKVDKIVGPGNIYVALAKKAVFGHVGIDSVAGPSEILVLADERANPRCVAADLLSQAEHDEMASAILVATDEALAGRVEAEIKHFPRDLSRRDIIEKSLRDHGYILTAPDLDVAIRAVNLVAPEHLEIMTKDPFFVMTRIRHAGAIFLGDYSSEPLGDYLAGPNHVLPTGGTARFFSPLSVDDFVKKSSIISYSRDALREVYQDIARFAEYEGLTAHANSVCARFGEEGEER